MAAVDTEIERMIVRLVGDGTSYKRMLRQGVKDTDQFTRDVLGRLRNAKGKIAKEFGSMDLGKTLTGAKLKEGFKIREQMATGAEKYANRMAKLNNLLQVGAIKQDTFDRASKKALETLNAPIKRAQELDSRKKAKQQASENKLWEKGQRDFQRQQRADNKAQERERIRAERQAAQRIPKLGNKFSQVGTSLKSIGSTGSFTMSAPMIGFGAAAINDAVKYQSAFTMIRALTESTDAEVSQFKRKIESLAVSTGRGPQELADAMYYLASAGLKSGVAMDVLDVSSRAAASGLGETKTIADLISSVLNAYGPENISAARATDILIAAVREGKGEAKGFAESMGFVIPIASELGVSFDQVAGAIAAMTQKGLQVDHSVTALKGIMTEIIHPSEQAADALASLKIKGIGTFDELRSAVKEKGLISVLNELYQAVDGDVKIMGTLFPEVRGLTGALNLLGQDSAKTVAIMDSVNNSVGSLDRAFRITSDSAGFKLNQTMSELKLVMIDVGNQLLPLVLKLAQFVSESLKVWQALSPEMKTAIITFAELTAAIFPTIYVFGLLASSVGSIITLYSLLGGASVEASFGMSALAVSMGPIVVAALAAAAAVLYLRNVINQANADADKSRATTDHMADAQLDQIRGMAGPDQKEAMDAELERRKGQLIASKRMRDERLTELNDEGAAKQAYRSTAKFITGADEMENLNKEVAQAEKAFEIGQQFKKEMDQAEIAAKNAANPPDVVIDAANGVLTKMELKNLNKAKSQAESLRKSNLSPQQKIAEDLQSAVKSHSEGNLSDEDFQTVVSNLHSRTEKLQASSPAAKTAREREKLQKQISDRNKTPAQKRAEEQKRLKELENGITDDAKAATTFSKEKAEEQVKQTNKLLAELVSMEKSKKNQTPVLLGESESF